MRHCRLAVIFTLALVAVTAAFADLADDFVAIPNVPQLAARPRHIVSGNGRHFKGVVAGQLNADLLVLDRIPWVDAHLSIDAYAIIRSSSCSILRL